MELFECENYKDFVNQLLGKMPKKGRGQYRRIAELLGVHPVYVSQVFRGAKDLSVEQAFRLCEHLGLSELEREYFLVLVQRERAGTFDLKEYFTSQLGKIRTRSQELKNRVSKATALSEETKAIFYSNWYYSGIRLLSSIDGYNDIAAIARRLGLEPKLVAKVVEFLLAAGLCVKEGGRVRMGPSVTHLESESPFIKSRQVQWRLRGMERMDSRADDELFYTAPMSLSREGLVSVRKELLKLVGEVGRIVGSADPQEVACLNIDWFKL